MDVLVTDALLVEPPGRRPEWASMVQVNDGGRAYSVMHYMPEDTVEIRCAEYGFDPVADRDEVLEIVMREPLTPQDSGMFRHPRFLFNNPNVGDARAFLRERFAGEPPIRTRNRRAGDSRPFVPPEARVMVDSDGEPLAPLAVIRRDTFVDEARVEVLAEHFTSVRRSARERRAARVAATQAVIAGARRRESADDLRRRLRTLAG